MSIAKRIRLKYMHFNTFDLFYCFIFLFIFFPLSFNCRKQRISLRRYTFGRAAGDDYDDDDDDDM